MQQEEVYQKDYISMGGGLPPSPGRRDEGVDHFFGVPWNCRTISGEATSELRSFGPERYSKASFLQNGTDNTTG
jgi:hypothetical protein